MWKIVCIVYPHEYVYELQHFTSRGNFGWSEYWGSWIGCINYMRQHKLSNSNQNRIMIGN